MIPISSIKNLFSLVVLLLVITGCETKDPNTQIVFEEYYGEPVVTISSECDDWAFGDSSESYRRSEMDDLWNKRHRDIFEAKGIDDEFDFYRRVQNACEGAGIK